MAGNYWSVFNEQLIRDSEVDYWTSPDTPPDMRPYVVEAHLHHKDAVRLAASTPNFRLVPLLDRYAEPNIDHNSAFRVAALHFEILFKQQHAFVTSVFCRRITARGYLFGCSIDRPPDRTKVGPNFEIVIDFLDAHVVKDMYQSALIRKLYSNPLFDDEAEAVIEGLPPVLQTRIKSLGEPARSYFLQAERALAIWETAQAADSARRIAEDETPGEGPPTYIPPPQPSKAHRVARSLQNPAFFYSEQTDGIFWNGILTDIVFDSQTIRRELAKAVRCDRPMKESLLLLDQAGFEHVVRASILGATPIVATKTHVFAYNDQGVPFLYSQKFRRISTFYWDRQVPNRYAVFEVPEWLPIEIEMLGI